MANISMAKVKVIIEIVLLLFPFEFFIIRNPFIKFLLIFIIAHFNNFFYPE